MTVQIDKSSGRAVLLGFLVMLVAGCAGPLRDPGASPTSNAPSASSSVSSTASDDQRQECLEATVASVESLSQAWRSVASISPGDQIAPLFVSSWVLKYRKAMSALSEKGCPAPPEELVSLDQAVPRLQTAADAGGEYLYDAIPMVAKELGITAQALGIAVGNTASTCTELTSEVTASFVLVDDDAEVGEELFPRVTVKNGGSAAVVVQLDGEGSATSDLGPAGSIDWGGYTDSRLTVEPGRSRSLDLGNDTGETLSVAPGERVIKAKMRAVVSSGDGALTGCPLGVQRASEETATTCGTAEKQHPGPFAGEWLSVEHRGQFISEVKAVQEQLNALGYHCTPADGDFGTETERLVRQFQRDHGLAPDGKVGPETWTAIFES